MNQKQYIFLQALLEESSVSKSVAKTGISRATAYRYLKDEAFCKELAKRRTECLNDTVRFLQGKLSICSEELINIINNPNTPQQVKVNAINLVYSTCKSMTETSEVIERLQEIEEAMKGGE